MTRDNVSAMTGAVKPPKRTRREQAADTRERIVRAATDVFAEAGYLGARMGDIAQRAGVAVQTVYFTFHTKGQLLQACLDHAVLGPDRLHPMDQPFLARLNTARSGQAALAAFVRGNTEILRRAARIQDVARAASHEPDAVAVLEHNEGLRREGLCHIASLLDHRFGLRVNVADATDLLLMMTSPATYLTLLGYGWNETKYNKWLTAALASELLAKPGCST